jgi:FSR family fosmidomycin resistance protein-like MFS transporter
MNDQLNQEKMNLKALLILSLGHLITDINVGGLPILLPYFKEALKLSYTASGAIIMTSTLSSSMIQPLLGYFSDRWGGIWVLPAGVITACAGFSVLGFAPSYSLLLLAVMVTGFGVAIYHPEGFKVAQFFTGARKATGMSFFSVGGNVGVGLGPLLAVYAYKFMGLKGTVLFILPGLLMIGILFAAMPMLSAPQRLERQRKSKGGSTRARPLGPRWVTLTLLLTAVTVRSWVQMGLIAFIPFYFVNVLKGDPLLVGKLMSVFLITGAFGTLGGAPIADRVGHKRFFNITMALMTPRLWLVLQSKGLWLFITLGVVGLVLVSTFTVTIVMAHQILPDRLGVASGLMTGFAFGTGGVGATILGSVADVWGVVTVLKITAWMPILSVLFALWMPYPLRFEIRSTISSPSGS